MKIAPVKVITPELVAEAEDLASRAGSLEEKITDRLHYIMLNIFNTFSKKDAYWYFYGAGEGEVGDLWRFYHEDSISVVVDNCPGESMVILLKDGSEWGLDDGIPTRWLYEDFEEELKQGKKKYEEKEAQRKLDAANKRKQSKEEAAKLAKIAKSKLSKKELAALKATL